MTAVSPEHSEEAAAPFLLSKRRRRPPSQAEQARRKAWGHKFGPLVGASIRKAIAESGR